MQGAKPVNCETSLTLNEACAGFSRQPSLSKGYGIPCLN